MPANYQVLLIEDDSLIAKTLKMSLPYKGFEVIVCESIRAGLDTFRKKTFDLLLIDINLPDGSGLELCRTIREENQTVPILLVTAQTDESVAVQGLEGGADDYIRKPY